MAFMLVLFTLACYAVPANQPSSGWPLMLVFDWIWVVLCLVNKLDRRAQPEGAAGASGVSAPGTFPRM